MNTPTPGPWEIRYADESVPENGGDVFPYLIDAPHETRHYVAYIPRDKATGEMPCEANARLIAAAPDLLFALIHARKVIRQWHDIGQPDEGRDEDVWRIYDQRSPEMKLINEAIGKALQP